MGLVSGQQRPVVTSQVRGDICPGSYHLHQWGPGVKPCATRALRRTSYAGLCGPACPQSVLKIYLLCVQHL